MLFQLFGDGDGGFVKKTENNEHVTKIPSSKDLHNKILHVYSDDVPATSLSAELHLLTTSFPTLITKTSSCLILRPNSDTYDIYYTPLVVYANIS